MTYTRRLSAEAATAAEGGLHATTDVCALEHAAEERTSDSGSFLSGGFIDICPLSEVCVVGVFPTLSRNLCPNFEPAMSAMSFETPNRPQQQHYSSTYIHGRVWDWE